MSEKIRNKILLALDGSDQSLEVVRYVGTVLDAGRTELVLFHVGMGFPEVFWEMNNNPLYHSKKNKVMGWLADSQHTMGEFKEKARKILTDLGYQEGSFRFRCQAMKSGVLADVVQESYDGYGAVAVGRTGMSRLKDLFMGSLAYKLVKNIKHIPTVVVDGQPDTGRIFIALDDSIEAMRGVYNVSVHSKGKSTKICLCHIIQLPGMFRISKGRLTMTDREMDWLEYAKNKFRPLMTEATDRLVNAGVSEDRIEQRFETVKGNIIRKLFETAQDGNFGTIMVGRRDAIGFFQEHFRGRFSEKIIGYLDNMAVWVVS